jgi:hypothetical protein
MEGLIRRFVKFDDALTPVCGAFVLYVGYRAHKREEVGKEASGECEKEVHLCFLVTPICWPAWQGAPSPSFRSLSYLMRACTACGNMPLIYRLGLLFMRSPGLQFCV